MGQSGDICSVWPDCPREMVLEGQRGKGKWLEDEGRKVDGKGSVQIIFLDSRERPSSGSFPCGSVVTNLANIHEVAGSIPGPAQWVKDSSDAMSCGVGRRLGLDPELLWLWLWLAAVALTEPLAWEPLYAAGVALKKQKKKKRPAIHHYASVP